MSDTLKNGETMKKEGDFMNVEDLCLRLSEFGETEVYHGFDEYGYPNGAIIINFRANSGVLNGEEYHLVVPATNWRRKTEKDNDDNVISVHMQEDPTLFQESEVSVFMMDIDDDKITEEEIKVAEKSIDHNLNPDKRTLGPEIEFNFSPTAITQAFAELMETVEPSGIIELDNCQREFPTKDPVNDTRELLTRYMQMMSRVLTSSSYHYLNINLAGTSADLRIKDPEFYALRATDPSKYAPYVDFVSKQLMAAMRQNYEFVPEHTKAIWEEIAIKNGFEGGVLHLLDEVDDLHHWLMNAGHVSINLESDEITGKVSPNVLRHNTNLSSYFRDIMNGLCYSGGMMFGVDTQIDGEYVADAREATRSLVATSQPADYIRPDENIADKTLTRMFRGDAIHPDRAGVATIIRNRELPNTHGDSRLRISISLKNFIQILENNSNGSERPKYNVNEDGTIVDLTASQRLEGTSRSSTLLVGTPDKPGRYIQSVDIQEILFKAANLATIDGYKDTFLWLKEVVGLVIDPETEYSKSLVQRLFEQNQCLIGEFPQDKLDSLETLVGYVNLRLQTEFGSAHPSAQGALNGINALRISPNFREEVANLSADEKLNKLVYDGYPNWGEFEISLTDEDMRYLLKVEDVSMTRDKLITALRHRYLEAQLKVHQKVQYYQGQSSEERILSHFLD